MYCANKKINSRMFKIRKPAGIKFKQIMQVIEEEPELVGGRDDDDLATRLDMENADVFNCLMEDMGNVKGRRNLEKFVVKNKGHINGLSSSSRHKFLNVIKEKFF